MGVPLPERTLGDCMVELIPDVVYRMSPFYLSVLPGLWISTKEWNSGRRRTRLAIFSEFTTSESQIIPYSVKLSREKTHEFWGFVAICKIWGHGIFGSTSEQSAGVFFTKILPSTNSWNFSPAKVSHYYSRLFAIVFQLSSRFRYIVM